MRKFVGFLLLSAGLAFGAFAYYPDVIDREGRLAELTSIVAAPAGDLDLHGPASSDPIRSFAPKHPIAVEEPATPAPVAVPARTTVVAKVEQPKPLAGVAPEPSAAWQTTVTPDPGAVPPGARLTSSKPGDDQTRYELVLSIQRELKRTGCYGGTLSGSWTANTKRAMGEFMERVNATLPANEPDYILLTLIKGHTTATCGNACPSGQSMNGDGRCLPNAIVAQSAKRPTPGDEKLAASTPKPSADGFATTVSTAEADTSTYTAPTRSASVAPAAPAAAPLPGRMAIGGPKVEPQGAGDSAWRVKIVPTPRSPSPPPAAIALETKTAPPAAAVETKKTAALSSDDALAQEPAVVDPVEAVPSPANGQTPSAGAPGSKSGRTVHQPRGSPPPVAYYQPAPAPRAAPPQRSRSVSVPRAPQQVYVRRGNYHTRSVQNIFRNPFGGG